MKFSLFLWVFLLLKIQSTLNRFKNGDLFCLFPFHLLVTPFTVLLLLFPFPAHLAPSPATSANSSPLISPSILLFYYQYLHLLLCIRMLKQMLKQTFKFFTVEINSVTPFSHCRMIFSWTWYIDTQTGMHHSLAHILLSHGSA